MLHPHTFLKFISEDIGYGIFANSFIPAGTITYVKDALEIELSPDNEIIEMPIYANHIKKYAYREPTGNHIIGWDLSKYMNHSCNPNTLSTGYGFEIAIRDIEADEEITDDYGMLNIESTMDCMCSQSDCRWQIHPHDLDFMWKQWDNNVKTALDVMSEVEQPLMGLLDHDIYRAIMHYLNTGKDYLSVKTLKYEADQHQFEIETF
jgi:hypothetical protein